MIKDRYKNSAQTESKKDPKPKPVKRQNGKDENRKTRDMVANRPSMGYQTR